MSAATSAAQVGETVTEQRMKILLVDDTPANLRLADAMLGDTYDIRTATSGKMALDMMKATVAPEPR